MISLCKTSGRSDDMVIQDEATNSKERQQFWRDVFRVGKTKRLEAGEDRHNGPLLGNPSIKSTILLFHC